MSICSAHLVKNLVKYINITTNTVPWSNILMLGIVNLTKNNKKE